MKILMLGFGLIFAGISKVFANPACTTVCPILLGASLGIARKLGVKDEVVGVLFGALLAVMGYWFIRFFEKRSWNFKGRNLLLMLLSVASVGFVYVNTLEYKPMLHWKLLYVDSFLFATICGAIAHILGVHLYAWLKEKNGGHAHFPFEKVVIPFLCDALMCYIFWGTDLCDCQEIFILN
ncbi:MAG: hypothetical protein J6Y03_05885 [Alphaproteobacteria bacterium]|nr:hypothetical protein [Alphaproteobacteria bacterium]